MLFNVLPHVKCQCTEFKHIVLKRSLGSILDPSVRAIACRSLKKSGWRIWHVKRCIIRFIYVIILSFLFVFTKKYITILSLYITIVYFVY